MATKRALDFAATSIWCRLAFAWAGVAAVLVKLAGTHQFATSNCITTRCFLLSVLLNNGRFNTVDDGIAELNRGVTELQGVPLEVGVSVVDGKVM
mmetsp:Transcript_859/g.2253  ORF Transcript_859/g.2253 Transcript_859/m.2253 type:complete len:95 (+) Transcript_859:351-635(+)